MALTETLKIILKCIYGLLVQVCWTSLVAQTVKNPFPMQETCSLIAGLGISPGEGNGYPLQYSYVENPWTEKPGGLQSMGLQRVGHD